MDRPRLSAAIIDELVQLFADTLDRNAEHLLAQDLDGIEQSVQDMARIVFGPVVEKAIMAIAATLPDQPPDCPQCHRPMRPVDYTRPRTLQGLVGEYRIVRPYF